MSLTQDYAKIILKHLAGRHNQLLHAGAKKKKGDEVHRRKGMSSVEPDWASEYYRQEDPEITAAREVDEEYAKQNVMPLNPMLPGREQRAAKYIAKADEDLEIAQAMFWGSFSNKLTEDEKKIKRAKANRAKAMAHGAKQAWDEWGRGGPSAKCDRCTGEFPQNMVQSYPAAYGLTRSVNICGECVSERVDTEEHRTGIGGKYVGGTHVESKIKRERAAGDLVQETVEYMRETSTLPEQVRPSGLSGEKFLQENDPTYWEKKPAWLRRKHEAEVRQAIAKKKVRIGEEYLSAEKPVLPGGPVTTRVELPKPEEPKKD